MKKLIPAAIGLLSVLIFGIGYYYSSTIIFFLGVLLVLVGVFSYISLQIYDLYQKEKTIDYELVKEKGLTLVNCPQCEKGNILEDVYCVHCGERLEDHEI